MEVCGRLTAWAREGTRGAQARGSAKASLRVLDAELLHVTLCFLGNRPAGEMDVLAAEPLHAMAEAESYRSARRYGYLSATRVCWLWSYTTSTVGLPLSRQK